MRIEFVKLVLSGSYPLSDINSIVACVKVLNLQGNPWDISVIKGSPDSYAVSKYCFISHHGREKLKLNKKGIIYKK